MKDNTNTWFENGEQLVDQRHLLLPPTWAGTGNQASYQPEQGHLLHESGRTRFVVHRLCQLLAMAQDKVIVASFLLADEEFEAALLAAAQRGVRVYVLLAIETHLGREESEEAFAKSVLAQHTAMLVRMAGQVLFRSAPHFHAKILITDPDNVPAGVLLTANLTSEALNRNEELAVELNKTEIAEALDLLGWAMWESAEHELLEPNGNFRDVKPMQCKPHPAIGKRIFATTAQVNSLREQAIALISSPKNRLIVSCFGWDVDHEVVQRICAQAKAGVEVTILARIRPSSMPALLTLAQAGAQVFGFKWLHAKAIWTDANGAMVMTANLQKDGLDQGFELGVMLHDARASELKQRLDAWAGAAKWQLHAAPRLGGLSGAVQIWQKQKLQEAVINEMEDVQLASVVAKSADEVAPTAPAMPAEPENGALPKLAHSVRYTWPIAPPKLAAKAKEVYRPAKGKNPASISYKPPVFREPNGRLVVAITRPSEIPVAKAVLQEVQGVAIVVMQGNAA